mmetsp:Transcript_4510/g.11123  ORF Transcript_4510/g.11123 Transcript_4510/m.11123 type:complete len:242 (+) Transcript_4510:250-975(+)
MRTHPEGVPRVTAPRTLLQLLHLLHLLLLHSPGHLASLSHLSSLGHWPSLRHLSSSRHLPCLPLEAKGVERRGRGTHLVAGHHGVRLPHAHTAGGVRVLWKLKGRQVGVGEGPVFTLFQDLRHELITLALPSLCQSRQRLQQRGLHLLRRGRRAGRQREVRAGGPGGGVIPRLALDRALSRAGTLILKARRPETLVVVGHPSVPAKISVECRVDAFFPFERRCGSARSARHARSAARSASL